MVTLPLPMPNPHPRLVYTRDATWHRHPSAKSSQLHWEHPVTKGMAACRPRFARLDMGHGRRIPGEVPSSLRCKRPGCRRLWDAFDTTQDTEAR